MISTGTLLFEMPWVIGAGGVDGEVKLQKAGSASRAGAKAGKVIRLVRMIRLVRLVRFFTFARKVGIWVYKRYVVKETHESFNEMVSKDDLLEENEKPSSHVGATMSELTNQRVISLIITMLIIIPLLSVSESDLSPLYAVQFINGTAVLRYTSSSKSDRAVYNSILNLLIAFTYDKFYLISSIKILDICITNRSVESCYIGNVDTSMYRNDELLRYIQEDGDVSTIITFANKDLSSQSAMLSLYTTLFIIGLLIAGTIVINQDIQRTVIDPIEHIILLVSNISKNPLADHYKDYSQEDGFADDVETTILLRTVSKIGKLMRVGFGEAGASIIASNMTGSKGLNLLQGGVMIRSIFGFCDVRQFTDTTECLQEEVMLFVNRIAHILHGIVVQCSGAANKNIGDAFLLTWKIEKEYSEEKISALADQALLTFCKSLIEINKHQQNICSFSVAAMNRLLKRFPDYQVRIGSGLHVGWAIEGALGSHRKIDATYLSPHVNFTEFLESSTKAYGVPLLLSQAFYELLSEDAQQFCRQVDRIKKSAKEEPLGLYTYDSDIFIDWADILKRRAYRATALHGENAIFDPTVTADGKPIMNSVVKIPAYDSGVWESDVDLIELRHLVNRDMRAVWEIGFEHYINGDWSKAKEIFLRTNEMGGGSDGPSKFLLSVIEDNHGVAPKHWAGYREEESGGH